MRSRRALRIAQVAPLYESTPPAMYGGTERVVAFLTDALVELGHEVTLFSSADARGKSGDAKCFAVIAGFSSRARCSALVAWSFSPK